MGNCQTLFQGLANGLWRLRGAPGLRCLVVQHSWATIHKSGALSSQAERRDGQHPLKHWVTHDGTVFKRFSTRLSSTALVATVMELALIARAPTTGLSRIPSDARAPPARGIASRL